MGPLSEEQSSRNMVGITATPVTITVTAMSLLCPLNIASCFIVEKALLHIRGFIKFSLSMKVKCSLKEQQIQVYPIFYQRMGAFRAWPREDL